MINAYFGDANRKGPVGGSLPEAALDEGWVGSLSRLGRIVMTLHQLAAGTAGSDFQRLAFEALRAELPFDSGVWATGVMHPVPMLHSVYAHNQPPEMMAAWQELIQFDTALAETLKRPGHTLRASPDGPEGCAPFVPEMREHVHRYGMEHVLATSYVDPASGLVEGFGLYRTDRRARFTEPERLLVQHALPHLVTTWRYTRLRPAG